MRFGVLGPLEVRTDRGAAVPVPGRKVRALLADLLVHEGRAVPADRLVQDLWGDVAPAAPAAALHVRISQLRRALAGGEPGGRDLVVYSQPGYALRAAPGAVDAERFAQLSEQAAAIDEPRARAAVLAEALALWRGPALADFADAEFVRIAVARWEERRLTTLEAYAEARLELGEHHELCGELAERVARHPYRERLRAAHLRALHRSGRTREALDGFQEFRVRLADELGLDPGPGLVALQRAILSGDPDEDPPAVRQRLVRSTVPAPVGGLFGRDHHVERVRELLATARLVTLTGTGGVGKTSVAIAVAHDLTDAYPDGVWLVDLTTWDGTGDPAEPVLTALAIPDAPGGPPAERLTEALRRRHALLVLDNCEHVIEPMAGLTGELLRSAPELRVLATSREPLRLRGEARWELPPLDVPDTDDPERLAGSPAVRLFLARAGLDATPETVAHAAEACRRLDGIPLALELAATGVPALGVPELAARLSVPKDRFGLLRHGPRDAPERQRTLEAVIEWSWRLLSEAERTVLARLAVHSGGCALDAAEAVCAGDGVPPDEVLDLLGGLVDRSLVARTDGPRYRLLESIAAYSVTRLRESGEEEALRRRHAEHYLSLAEHAETRLRGPGQHGWLCRLDTEAPNLRTALDTFRRAGAAEPALRLAVALVWYWYLRGRLGEARRALGAALAMPGDVPGDVPAELRSAAEAWDAGLAIRQGQARPERAADVLDAYPDGAGKARAEWFLATAIIDYGDQKATGELLERALRRFRADGDTWGEAAALSTRAMLAHMRQDMDAVGHDARRGAELFTGLGDDWGVLQATDWLIGRASGIGDHAEAARLSREGLRTAEELGLLHEVAARLAWLAWTAVQTGDPAPAIEQADRARRLAAEQGQRATEVFATLGLAYAARRCGDLDLAEEHLGWLLATARAQQTADASPPYLGMVEEELELLAADRARSGDRA